jgi:hypothetical protein
MGMPISAPGLISNPGQPQTAAMHYTSSVVVYTAMEKVECVVDGAPPGPNGRLFIVEVDDPTEVPYEAARFMLEHMTHTGVVRVDEIIETDARGKRTGVRYNVEKARAESMELGRQSDEMRWQRFISDMMEDYVSRRDGKNKVVPPPPAPILRIIERRGYKLSDYGINPVGFQDPTMVANQAIKDENSLLRQQMAKLQDQMAELLAMRRGDNANANIQETDPNEFGANGVGGASSTSVPGTQGRPSTPSRAARAGRIPGPGK